MKKKTLVIGASTNPERYGYKASMALISAGHPVELYGIKKGEINGLTINNEQIPFDGIDTVTLYVGPKNQADIFDYVIGLKPNRVIFNPGTENPEFFEILNTAGIAYEAACTLVLLSTDQF